MRDPRIAAVFDELGYACAGGCPLSRNQHIHFPKGMSAFIDELSAAVAEPIPPAPAPVDPVDALTDKWRRAFAVVWAEMKDAGQTGDAALVKAAELALVMAR